MSQQLHPKSMPPPRNDKSLSGRGWGSFFCIIDDVKSVLWPNSTVVPWMLWGTARFNADVPAVQ